MENANGVTLDIDEQIRTTPNSAASTTDRVRNFDGTVPADGELPSFYANIDEQGNVLFLDAERLGRKTAGPGPRPIYKNKPNGLGIKNFIVTHTSARQWNWKVVLKVFAWILNMSKVLKKPGSLGDRIYRKAMMFDPPEQSYSAGFAFNLNVDVPEDRPGTAHYNDYIVHKNTDPAKQAFACKHDEPDGKSAKAKTIEINKRISDDVDRDTATVTLPIDLVKKAIDEAEYIGGMKECLCRAGRDCQDYPHDLACLFLNLGGRVVVDHGMAVELTKEEAYERVEKAAASRSGFKSSNSSGASRTTRWTLSLKFASAARAAAWA